MYLGQMDVRTGRTSMQMYLENLGQKSKKPGRRSRQKENRKLARRDERIVSGDRIILRRICREIRQEEFMTIGVILKLPQSAFWFLFEPGIKTQRKGRTGVSGQALQV